MDGPIVARDPSNLPRAVACDALGRLLTVLAAGGADTQTDEITGALVTIPVVHHEVHEGEMFQSSYLGLSILNNNDITILIRAGSRYCHLTYVVAGGGDFEVEVLEDVTVSAQGTALARNNMKRYDTRVATAATFHTPTIAGGDTIANFLVPGGVTGRSTGAIARENTEWILSPNTDYAIIATNRAGNTQPGSVVAQWYEEETA